MSTDTDTITKTKTKVKTPSMWKVVLHNDDFTPMDFVTQLIMHLFHKNRSEAENIMMTIHTTGRGTVGIFTKEVADTKVIQVKEISEQNGHPLLATKEEA